MSSVHIGPPQGKPIIKCGPDEARVIDQAIKAARAEPNLFSRAGQLVQTVEDGPGAAARIATTALARVQEILAERALWKTRKGEGDPNDAASWQHCHPPLWAVKGVMGRGQWPELRHLVGLIEHPTFRPDGTLFHGNGYDEATGLYGTYRSTVDDREVRERAPHQERHRRDAEDAIKELLEVVVDFPLDFVPRSVWLAHVLTPFVRHAFDGLVPIFAYTANIRGAGKTTLASLPSSIARGAGPRTVSYPENEAETRKLLTTLALECVPEVLFDNLLVPFGGGAINTAATSRIWSDRLLGANRSVGLPWGTVMASTGNNLEFAPDTGRRTLLVNLRTDLERPEERTGFAHPDLYAWVQQERFRLVGAALSIIASYIAAGRPHVDLRPMGGYEEWSRWVRAPLVWAGQPDPGLSQDEVRQRDSEEQIVRLIDTVITEYCNQPHLLHPLPKSKHLLERARHDPAAAEMVSALCPAVGGRRPDATALGRALARYEGRVLNGRRLASKEVGGSKVWFIDSVP